VTRRNLGLGRRILRANRKHLGDLPSEATRVEGRLTESLSC